MECTNAPPRGRRSVPEGRGPRAKGATERRRASAHAGRHDREATERSERKRERERQTEQASRPTDRQGGTQGVCLCVCARGLMIRVYHSPRRVPAPLREGPREMSREAGRCNGDR